MQSNRRKDTTLELGIRSALHRAGFRFRKNRRPVVGLRCEADVIFTAIRLAVFIDGCFWHGCPQHATRPVTHGEWWAAKLDRNMERDRLNDGQLRLAGWTVCRIWEHEGTNPAVARVADLVRGLKQAKGRSDS